MADRVADTPPPSWTFRVTRAEIIAVGSELLTPNRIDTNSLYITARLNEIGITVVAKTIVGDDEAEIAARLRTALDRVPLVVFSGGLGPTDDDLTRQVVAQVLNRPATEDPALVDWIRDRFARRGLVMPEINRRQAMVPRGAVVLENRLGSAPGLWLEDEDHIVVLLPGPPNELQSMWTQQVIDRLTPRTGGHQLARRVIRIAGRSESHAEEALRPRYADWNAGTPPIAVTILASLEGIELHLSAQTVDREAADRTLDAAVAEVFGIRGDDVFSTDNRSMEEVVGALLKERGERVAAAESCTGGLLIKRLTDVPGSSAYVDASAITYSNAAKTEWLGVPADLIAAHGAVSEPVAREMAAGVRRRAGVEWGIGITGVAGPSGGSDKKPVGTVMIALSGAAETSARSFRFNGDRQQIRLQATQTAMDWLRRRMLATR